MTCNLKNTIVLFALCFPIFIFGQIGSRLPSERKAVVDPVTGVELIFLTSQPEKGDCKIYPTQNQWTSDGQWLIFRSDRIPDEAIAVHEETGDMVQVTEGGYFGTLAVSRKNMLLYYMRAVDDDGNPAPRRRREPQTAQIVEVDIDKLFADSEAATLKNASHYIRICGVVPASIDATANLALDANEEIAYFRVGREEAGRYIPAGTKIEENFGPRNMGAGPGGIASMNLKTGELKHVISVPFQLGH